MKLKGKQKRYLRAQAHGMRPLFQVGKEGLSANWLAQITDAIEKRELFKVNILQNAMVEDEEVIAFIEENTDIQVVQKIGHVLVLFKQADKKDDRSYSLEVNKL